MLTTLLPALGLLVRSVISIAIESGSLRANAARDPIDVDTPSPRLTWRLHSEKRGRSQTAYHIQASSTKDVANADLWDSGKINSETPFVFYDGERLSSRSSVTWRIKVWDNDDEASEWSAGAHFELSLLEEDDWEASWITNTEFETGNTSLPLFAKEFDTKCEVLRARLYLLGLGIHIPEINGERITDQVLQPGYSTYEDTLLYSTYDVTKFLIGGANVLGVALGKGIYDAEEPLLGRYHKFSQEYQELRLIAQLEYECVDGDTKKILSDDSWLTSVDGPYWETSWFGGEEYDARKEIPDWSTVDGNRSNWDAATVTERPGGKMISPRSPPLKVTDTVKPVSVSQNDDGLWVYDFGVNFAGMFEFSVKANNASGTRIVFWPDEQAGLGQGTTGSPIFDAYTLSGKPSQKYSPQYVYHGFQFLGVNTTWEPSLDDMTGFVIRAANELVLNVTTSSDILNNIHKMIDRSIQGNMHSVLTDCPHREKYGWLEQDHLVFEPLALGYDFQAYGDDLIRTMADAQAEDVPGLIPDIAPEYGSPMGGGYRNDPNWGRAIINVPYLLYWYYGDANVLKMKHQYMIEYIDYLQGRAGDQSYLNDGGLGDWLALDTTTPKGVASTFGYHQAAFYLAKIQRIFGNDESADLYEQLADDIVDGFNSVWFNETGFPHYCETNTQACQAFALDMGAVPEEHKEAVLSNLVDLLEDNNGLITVGEIALPSLFRVLRAAGYDEILFNWMTSTEMPSYGYELEHGATSLWEHWDADETGGSFNHFMYGYGDLFILQLSGLRQSDNSTAWREIIYDPVIQGDLTHASTSYITPAGKASAEWSVDGDDLSYLVQVPVGSKGVVHIYGTNVKEGGKSIHKGLNGVVDFSRRDGVAIIEIGSGDFEFSATLA